MYKNKIRTLLFNFIFYKSTMDIYKMYGVKYNENMHI